MPALLEAENLEAQYGWTKVLHGLRFAVEAGGITTILGANGAGKTTTLRAVCGMVKTAGIVRFEGRRIDGKATEEIVRLGIAHTPEGRGTFMNLTVQENLRLGAYVRKDRTALAGDFERVYQYFPVLAQRQRQQAGTLSGGEQQMLAVARALMSRPRLLLTDETGGWSRPEHDGHLYPASRVAIGDGWHLRKPRLGPRHDLPGYGRRELRPGRDGDVQHVPLLVSPAGRPPLLGRLLRHPRHRL